MPNLKLPTNRLLVVAIVAASTTVLANILWALASGGARDALTITGVLAFAATIAKAKRRLVGNLRLDMLLLTCLT